MFFQNVLNDKSNIPEETFTNIKTKLRSSCEKYYDKETLCKYKKVVSDLSKNSSIIALKQEKGRGVVIMNCTKYLEKCYTILNSSQFTKPDRDPTCYMENEVQRTLRKVKSTMPQNVYSKLYPSGSCPGRFYGTHKLLSNNVEDLSLRPIMSNIGIATCQTAKYLAKLLSPLGTSEYTISNTKTFVKQKQTILSVQFKCLTNSTSSKRLFRFG